MASDSETTFQVRPSQVTVWLVSILSVLFFFHLCGLVSEYLFGYDSLKGLVPLFDMGLEQNIPTLFSFVCFLTAAALLAFLSMAQARRGEAFGLWAGLSLLFLFFAVDEAASIHEKLGYHLDRSGIPDYLKLDWIIPYAILTCLVGVIYLRFWLRLPKHFRKLFLLSGALFVVGALGMELVFVYLNLSYPVEHISIAISETIEELFEFSGLILFIYSLLAYLEDQFGTFSLQLGGEKKG